MNGWVYSCVGGSNQRCVGIVISPPSSPVTRSDGCLMFRCHTWTDWIALTLAILDGWRDTFFSDSDPARAGRAVVSRGAVAFDKLSYTCCYAALVGAVGSDHPVACSCSMSPLPPPCRAGSSSNTPRHMPLARMTSVFCVPPGKSYICFWQNRSAFRRELPCYLSQSKCAASTRRRRTEWSCSPVSANNSMMLGLFPSFQGIRMGVFNTEMCSVRGSQWGTALVCARIVTWYFLFF